MNTCMDAYRPDRREVSVGRKNSSFQIRWGLTWSHFPFFFYFPCLKSPCVLALVGLEHEAFSVCNFGQELDKGSAVGRASDFGLSIFSHFFISFLV